jgi:hypothetical protein
VQGLLTDNVGFLPCLDCLQVLQPNDGLTLRSGQDGDDYRRDSIERDEKRLAELGRKTIEMFVIAHIFCEKLEIAYREAEALKRQDQLIKEEFEMAQLEESKAQAKAQADKEKKAKKKVGLPLDTRRPQDCVTRYGATLIPICCCGPAGEAEAPKGG